MIFDRLNNAKQYYSLNEKLKKGFDFLLNSDLANLKEGKHIIEGDTIYANVQTLTTKPISEQKWEVHRKYIDIQYVIKGSEVMGYGILEDFKKTITPYDATKDVAFLDEGKYNYVNVCTNDFVIFYPNDVHAPMLYADKEQQIKKIIVKIAL
ncbi:MAG: YhcH/YjgK/YiaL family protein [Candidatus Gastranaerophilales bacterium]|nr:YhcH/YjgK/YiaL family protein [Candidatus Gastranaerophilales bacterium]